MSLLRTIEPGDGLVSVVGAGGKTTTVYALAARTGNAVVTSTVRIPILDRAVARVAVTQEPLEGLADAGRASFPLGLVPERYGGDRYGGYDPGTVDDIAEAHDGPVLVKADGARMREFKAPGNGEPPIPAATDVVVPVVSAHAVGKPLTERWVHRPEQVAALAGVDVGDEVTAETVAAVLTDEQGGLKNVPPDASVVPLVTKIDSEAHERDAREVADRIHERADALPVDLPRVGLARFDVVETVQ
jgi:probable selenium-dependent hydroxylase accessory protein YqeC